MLILRREYKNLLSQPIQLDVYRYDNCCHFIITRTTDPERLKHRWPWRDWYACCSLIIMLTLSSMITCDGNQKDLLIILLIFLILFHWFLSCKSHIYKESLILMDNVSGVETIEHNFFGEKRSSFVLTNHIVINEAITMHRVIYYLVAIPPSLSSSLLSKPTSYIPPSNKKMNLNTSSGASRPTLVPLFRHTRPRLDCLKVIYQHIQLFKEIRDDNHSNKIHTNTLGENNSKDNCLEIKLSGKNGFKSLSNHNHVVNK